jgi:predicted nucleic acid-binding protein
MAAERRTFTDALEPFIYWDTSFVVAVFEPTEPFHAPCLAFANRCQTEALVPAVSDFVFDEFAFLLVRDALKAVGRAKGQFWLDVHKSQPHAVAKAMPTIQPRIDTLEGMVVSLPIRDSVMKSAFQLMHRYSLLPTDAYHLATAMDHGVHAFASLDEDFLRVDGIIVYTV